MFTSVGLKATKRCTSAPISITKAADIQLIPAKFCYMLRIMPKQLAGDNDRSPEEWAASYASQRSSYAEFARRLEQLLLDLLRAEKLDVIQVESRAKTVASFTEKVRAKGHQYADPLNSITDLVGLRVITYYLDDVDHVGEVLQREFAVDNKNSMDKSEGLASDQFGYRSAHFIVKLKPSRARLPEWRAYAGLAAEIQVRTSLQHAWAAVSHKLEYKAAEEAPAPLRRRLMRLSALFELADDQFAAIRDEKEATFTAYRQDVTQGRLEKVPVDTSSLAAYWSLSDNGQRLRALLKSKGLPLEDDGSIEEKRLTRDRADLVKVLRECGLDTLAAFDKYIHDTTRLLPLLEGIKEAESQDPGLLTQGSIDDILTEMLLVDMDMISSEVGVGIYLEGARKALTFARSAAHARGFVPIKNGA